jgi:hypothetical protein
MEGMGKNDDVQRQMGSESLLRFRPSDKPIEHEAFPIPDIAGDFTPSTCACSLFVAADVSPPSFSRLQKDADALVRMPLHDHLSSVDRQKEGQQKGQYPD